MRFISMAVLLVPPMVACGSNSTQLGQRSHSDVISDAAPDMDATAPLPDGSLGSGGDGADLVARANDSCSGDLSSCDANVVGGLLLSDPSVVGLVNDGVLSRGEQATVSVQVTNTSAVASDYCLGLVAEPGIRVSSSQNADDAAWACQFGDLPAGDSSAFTWQVRISETAGSGSTQRLAAYVTRGQSACPCGGGPWLQFEVSIR